MQIESLEEELVSLREDLLNHQLYQNINSIQDVQVFMESHVFAVWDFMSLLKALQIELTTVSIPWVPKGHPLLSRFINEIVLAEESDLNECYKPMSHFEMYLDAMREVGADTSKIDKLINHFMSNNEYGDIDESLFPSRASKEFTDFTFQIIAIYYLDRHIEIDSGEHGPMATNMIKELCGNDEVKWKESIDVSKQALTKRIGLWDSIAESIDTSSGVQLNYSES